MCGALSSVSNSEEKITSQTLANVGGNIGRYELGGDRTWQNALSKMSEALLQTEHRKLKKFVGCAEPLVVYRTVKRK